MAAADAPTELGYGSYDVSVCANDHVHVRLTRPDGPVELVFPDPDEAYNFAQALLRAYDEAVGIRPPGE